MTRRKGTQRTQAIRRRLNIAQLHTLQQAETYGAVLLGVRTSGDYLPIVQVGDDVRGLDVDGEFIELEVRTGRDRRNDDRE